MSSSKLHWSDRPSTGDVEFIPWAQTILCIYLVTTIPWRLAFCPEFRLSTRFPGFLICDLVATIFFSYETIRSIKLQWNATSEGSIIPITNEPPKKYNPINHGSRFLDGSMLFKQSGISHSRWKVFLSCAATIPFEYASILFVGNDHANYFMINRALRVFCLPNYLNDLSMILGRKGYLNNIGVRRTWILFFTMALAGHWCGCGFFFVAQKRALSGMAMTWPEVAGIYVLDSKMGVGGKQEVELRMESTALEAYIKSLYWAYITMVSTQVNCSLTFLYHCLIKLLK